AAGHSDPCSLCEGKKLVACPTCAGSGRATIECLACKGTGKTSCGFCNLSPKQVAALPIKLKRGWLPCLNPYCDKKGLVQWKSSAADAKKDPGKDPCKVCDGKGMFHCPACTDGMAPCGACGGRGRMTGTCGDCAGSGTLECPGCTARASSKSCPICHN